MKKIIFVFTILLFVSGCASGGEKSGVTSTSDATQHSTSSVSGGDTTHKTKKIALTFDDGPYGTSTAQILDILKEKKVSATFFILGKQVERFPEQARRMVNEGHIIGNHSYDHAKNLASVSAKVFQNNLGTAESTIIKATGVHPILFRPPYGSLSQTMHDVLKQEGYRNVLWTIDPQDWNYPSSTSDQIVDRVVKKAAPGAIVLLHDGRDTHINFPRDNTVNALPALIDSLKKYGYTFVTIDKL